MNIIEFLNKRNLILSKWHQNVKKYLDYHKSFDKTIYDYLNRYGYINFGTVTNRPIPTKKNKKVIVIGAGMAGIATATQLKSFGYEVIVVEGRKRNGGRVHTKSTYKDKTLSTSLDMGGAILTGLIGNQLTVLCKQQDVELHTINNNSKLFDFDGTPINKKKDTQIENVFNGLLDDACNGKETPFQSLGDQLDMKIEEKEFSEQESRLLNWHIANLEYGCGIFLKPVSLYYWDQDDEFELEGDHCFIKPGYGSMINNLAKGLNIIYSQNVKKINYKNNIVEVETDNGRFKGDYVVCTVSLGVLKSEKITFEPELPDWKKLAIERLGFGLLNKMALYFDDVFWEKNLDYFGYLNKERRGEFYLFWNMFPVCGKPVLVSLIAGAAAYETEQESDDILYERIMGILEKIFGNNVKKPNKFYRTRWYKDEFAKGSYSYIKVGSKGGIDYDIIGRRVDKVFFAGEATCKDHPSTVLGALISGLRCAGSIEELVTNKKRKRDMYPNCIVSLEKAQDMFQNEVKRLFEKKKIENEKWMNEIVKKLIVLNENNECVVSDESWESLDEEVDKFVSQINF